MDKALDFRSFQLNKNPLTSLKKIEKQKFNEK